MTTYIAIMGLAFFCFGLLTAVEDDGSISFVSPALAGCGMATFLGVMAAQVLA